MRGKPLLLEDVEAVLSSTTLSGVTGHLEQRHITLQRVAQVVAVTEGQRSKGHGLRKTTLLITVEQEEDAESIVARWQLMLLRDEAHWMNFARVHQRSRAIIPGVSFTDRNVNDKCNKTSEANVFRFDKTLLMCYIVT